jgi:hypothetical protein
MADMMDYKSTVGVYCNGYVAIGFRQNSADYDINKNNFILNSCGDGWFRKDKNSGISSSHGLLIRNIKLTNRKKHFYNGVPNVMGELVGDFICYKAEIEYETNDFDPEVCYDKFWVFVHKTVDIKDVLCYINDHKNEWQA